MESRLVSIVMPSFNSKNYIEQTISSVKNQTYKEWELIIVDDCSNDGTQEFISQLIMDDSRIKLIRLEKNNGGPAVPRNIGVGEAKGRWIALLDSDDIWHPKKLEIQIDAMLKYDVHFSSTSSINFKDESEINLNQEFDDFDIQKITFFMEKVKGRTPNSSVIVEKDLLLRYPFNELAAYRAVEDYDCWLRIHKEIGESIKLTAPLLYYRILDGQISGAKLKMLKKVFRVHAGLGDSSITAGLCTVSHAIGGAWYRFVKNGF